MKKTMIFFSVIICVVLLMKFLSNRTEEYYSEFQISSSINESKNNGVFIKSIKIKPKIYYYLNNVIEFTESWMERKSKIKYSFLFKKKVVFKDKKIICFKTNNNNFFKLFPKVFFVINDLNEGVSIQNRQGDITFYYELPDNNLDNLHMSLLENWKKPREKDIKIVVMSK